MPKGILNINKVDKTFKETQALNNLDLSVNESSILGLVGPNGAGKTTLINCIAGLIEIDSGEIEIFDTKLKGDAIDIKKRMGFIFENTESLFMYLTGEEQLNFVADIYGLGKSVKQERVEELLDFFELEEHRNKLIEEYSKGLRKKLAFASILLYNPDLIILDEPFDGLDVFSVIKVKKLIKLLREKGKTILVTSHILSYIEDMADEIAIIHKGIIIYQSATKDIRNKIKNELTKETYQSLEEVFLDLTTEKELVEKTLSWL